MLAITNVKLYTITNGIVEGSLLVDDNGRIAGVGDVSIPEGTTVVDGEGQILMPGMIDPHGHAGVHEEGLGKEGQDFNEMVDPITPQLRALDGLNPEDEGISEALAHGVTTMCVVPGSANVIGGQGVTVHLHGNTVEEMIITEQGGLKVAFGENPKRVYTSQSKSPTTRMATAALLRENLVKAQNYLAKLANEEPGKPVERDLKLEVLAKVIKKELPLRAHAHRADDIMTAVRIAEEFDVNIVIEHCTDGHKVAYELAKRNIPAVVGPSLTTRSKVELRDRNFATLKVLHEAGVLIAITTDHPVIHVQYLPLAAAFAVKAGLPEEAALQALTINGARILGIDQDYGSLEVGKYADVVLWDNHPFDVQSSVKKVWIQGKLVCQN